MSYVRGRARLVGDSIAVPDAASGTVIYLNSRKETETLLADLTPLRAALEIREEATRGRPVTAGETDESRVGGND